MASAQQRLIYSGHSYITDVVKILELFLDRKYNAREFKMVMSMDKLSSCVASNNRLHNTIVKISREELIQPHCSQAFAACLQHLITCSMQTLEGKAWEILSHAQCQVTPGRQKIDTCGLLPNRGTQGSFLYFLSKVWRPEHSLGSIVRTDQHKIKFIKVGWRDLPSFVFVFWK